MRGFAWAMMGADRNRAKEEQIDRKDKHQSITNWISS
jgi:hypothetical protein